MFCTPRASERFPSVLANSARMAKPANTVCAAGSNLPAPASSARFCTSAPTQLSRAKLSAEGAFPVSPAQPLFSEGKLTPPAANRLTR